MNSTQKYNSLEELVRACCHQNIQVRELAWYEFLKQYKLFIYQTVTNRCRTWNVSRLKLQFSDTVNDIVSEVFNTLFISLADYRNVDNEQTFRYWLATICNRTASHYLKNHFFSSIVMNDIGDFKHHFSEQPFDGWELYESLVQELRSNQKTKKRVLERDICIFQLYVWADFSKEMILSNPCLYQVGHRVVDNVVNRMRDYLKKGPSELN